MIKFLILLVALPVYLLLRLVSKKGQTKSRLEVLRHKEMLAQKALMKNQDQYHSRYNEFNWK